MKLDVSLWVNDLQQVPAAAQAAEALGFGALWTSDTAHNPHFPLILAAEHSQHIQLGTAIVVAFARSPMDVAYQAWDLARYSRGRYLLGLGTQVQAKYSGILDRVTLYIPFDPSQQQERWTAICQAFATP